MYSARLNSALCSPFVFRGLLFSLHSFLLPRRVVSMDSYQLGTLDLGIRPNISTNQRLCGWRKENLGHLFHSFFLSGFWAGRGWAPLPQATAPVWQGSPTIAALASSPPCLFPLVLSSLGVEVVSGPYLCRTFPSGPWSHSAYSPSLNASSVGTLIYTHPKHSCAARPHSGPRK